MLAHDDEFIAAKAGHRVAGPYGHPHPAADLHQRCVAGRVAMRVVDALEVVEVDEQHGSRATVSS